MYIFYISAYNYVYVNVFYKQKKVIYRLRKIILKMFYLNRNKITKDKNI